VADQNLYHLAWLSNDSFAYSSRTYVRVVTRQAKGNWVHKKYFENVAANMENFTAISDSSVAWRDGGGIWLLKLGSGSSEKIWEATPSQLVDFTGARGANELLLNCSDERGQYLLRLNLDDKGTIDAGRIGSQQDYIRNAIWNSQGTSYAYLTNDLAGSAFCVKTEETETPTIIPWQGGVRSFTLSGDRLLFSGNPDDQPPGIWECDIESKAFKCILSSTGGPLKYSLQSPTSCETMTNSLGEQRFYHLWAPPGVFPNRKYPLLLAQEFNTWFPCFQIAAHTGYYVAVVDRPFFHTWDEDHERTWVEDVGSLYEIMAQNPDIDTNRVYLYACSAETSYLSQLMDERPLRVRGALLFCPAGLPDLTALQNKRLVMMDGTADDDATHRLSEFQDRAAQAGCEVTLLFQDGAGHMAVSGGTERKMAMLFASFLSEQR
jgi:dipeptidyl aminopeptidase/acylaminoacyl peptidase